MLFRQVMLEVIFRSLFYDVSPPVLSYWLFKKGHTDEQPKKHHQQTSIKLELVICPTSPVGSIHMLQVVGKCIEWKPSLKVAIYVIIMLIVLRVSVPHPFLLGPSILVNAIYKLPILLCLLNL